MFKKDTVMCISFGLEPRTAKVVRVVPRGERTSNSPDLPDYRKVRMRLAQGLVRIPMGNENELTYKPR